MLLNNPMIIGNICISSKSIPLKEKVRVKNIRILTFQKWYKQDAKLLFFA